MKKLTTQEFIEKSKQIYGDKFDYSQTVFNGYRGKVKLICKKHGEFIQDASYHLTNNGRAGCTKCVHESDATSWKQDEDDFLKKYYQTKGLKFCSEKLNRSIFSTKVRASRLNVSKKITKRPRHNSINPIQVSNMIKNAECRGFKFEMTLDDVYDKIIKQNYKCALSGLKIAFSKNIKENTASLDRIDSTKGYTVDNTQLVHKEYNRMKTDFQEDELFEMCKNVYLNLKNKYE
jgi:hypothetical protein